MAKRWQAPPGGGHVVADYYIGNTHIIVCDDFCANNTQQDNDAIMARAGRIVQEAYAAQIIAQRKKQQNIQD